MYPRILSVNYLGVYVCLGLFEELRSGQLVLRKRLDASLATL